MIAAIGLSLAAAANERPHRALHYAPNSNFDANGKFLPGEAGFDVADVMDPIRLKPLPAGVKALVWIGQCDGVTDKFKAAVQGFLGNPKVFGFYLMDDPDPRTIAIPKSSYCSPGHLREESDWLHQQMVGVKTFVGLMNLGNAKHPSFQNSYNWANTHVDLFGVAAYPCRTELNGCDYDLINRFVLAAESSGVSRDQVVPIYQSFGGGLWKDDAGGRYVLPSAQELRSIIDRWHALVPNPIFDMAYSWGRQREDESIDGSPQLKPVFFSYNAH